MKKILQIPRQYHIKKKVRGSKRKLLSFRKKLEALLKNIPNDHFVNNKVLQYVLPNPSKLIDSTNSSNKLRRNFLQMLSDNLVELDQIIKGKYQALMIISVPFISQSRINICIDSKYFEQLINNTATPSTWIPMEDRKNIINEFELKLPPEYKAKGYTRTTENESYKLTEENWIIWKG